jgi:hypothetical protein
MNNSGGGGFSGLLSGEVDLRSAVAVCMAVSLVSLAMVFATLLLLLLLLAPHYQVHVVLQRDLLLVVRGQVRHSTQDLSESKLQRTLELRHCPWGH